MRDRVPLALEILDMQREELLSDNYLNENQEQLAEDKETIMNILRAAKIPQL